MSISIITPRSWRPGARRSAKGYQPDRRPHSRRSTARCMPSRRTERPVGPTRCGGAMHGRRATVQEPLYVICRSGAGAGRRAKSSSAGFENVVNVEGGTLACDEAGLPSSVGRSDLAGAAGRIAAGSLVLLGVRSAGSSIPAFIGLSAFVGAGLVFAGITDTCGMGMLLARMPWNQRRGVRFQPCSPGSRCGMNSEEVPIMKLVIVGGVAGGASAAARARRLSEDAEIVLFERGPDVSFANCGLPYYIGGEIAERDKLLVTTPERLRTRFNLDVRTRTSVEAIDRAAKNVRVRDLASGPRVRRNLRQADPRPGGGAVAAADPGHRPAGHFHACATCRTWTASRQRVDQGVQAGRRRGGGFIGLELVENFVRRGIATTVVELQDQVLPPFDKEMTHAARPDAWRHRASTLLLGQSAEAFEPDDRRTCRAAEVGRAADGPTGCSGRRRAAGEQAGGRGRAGGRASRRHPGQRPSSRPATRTSTRSATPSRSTDFVTGEPTQVPLAGPANRQGRIAADHIFGRPVRYRGTQGTAIVARLRPHGGDDRGFGKVLRRANRPYRKVYIHPAHHAGYYPGAEAMTLKLLFDPETGQVLGAQAVGGAGVDKRIDVLAVAIQAGMTVFDLEEMELAYSPQYGSAKDPINMAGFRGRRPAARRPSADRLAAVLATPPAEAPVPAGRPNAGGVRGRSHPRGRQHPRGRPSAAGRTAPRPGDRRLLPGRAAGLPGDPHLVQAGLPANMSAAGIRPTCSFIRRITAVS